MATVIQATFSFFLILFGTHFVSSAAKRNFNRFTRRANFFNKVTFSSIVPDKKLSFSPMKYWHDDFWEREMKRRERKKSKHKVFDGLPDSKQFNRSNLRFCDCIETEKDFLNLSSENSSFASSSSSFSSEEKQIENEEYEKNEKESGITLHFCFLVHGYKGMSSDLSYLELAMNKVSTPHNVSSVGTDIIIVHNVVCNEKRTEDGVEKGGERVVDEVMSVIKDEMTNYCTSCRNITNVTLSFVGNSLGGLYSRYAIARIHDLLLSDKENDIMQLENGIQVHFNVFCSTASPHLGVANHTYIPLPRPAEIGLGYAMGHTGRDLFRINDLIWTMATSDKYLKPLGSFRKRIAYANAFQTDFPVPTETAAFLHSSSRHPHHLIDDMGDEYVTKKEYSDLIIASFHTVKQQDFASESKEMEFEEKDEFVVMSTSLDSLGWKKVFVDMRTEIRVGINLSRVEDRIKRNRDINKSNLDSLREKGIIESRDLASTFTSIQEFGFNLPIGHNMICAHSRNRFHTLVNRGGRPVMDKLAKEMIEDIVLWNKE